jgi:hypothetical protein
MKKFFGFGSSTPPPPPPPAKPPVPPAKPAAGAAPAPAKSPTPPGSDRRAAEGAKPAPPARAAASIVGRWKDPSSNDTTEFHADGSVTERTGSGETIRGRYSLQDKQLKINLEGVADELSFPVAIGPDKLEMTDPDGKIASYQRIS